MSLRVAAKRYCTSMCLLFTLSKYSLLSILSESLSTKDLLLLDTSLTNCHERKLFLELIKDHSGMFQKHFLKTINFNQFIYSIIWYAKNRNLNYDEIALVINTRSSFYQNVYGLDSLHLNAVAFDKTCLNEFKTLQLFGNLNAPCFPMKDIPNLVFLVASDYYSFESVGQYCRSLVHLEIHSRDKQSLGLEEVFRQCKQLTHFHWRHDGYTRYSRVMQAMVVHGSALTSIKLSSTSLWYSIMLLIMHGSRFHLTEVSFEYIEDHFVNALLWYRGAQLESLGFSRFYLTGRNEILAVEAIKGICEACPRLTEVSMLPFIRAQPDAIIELLRVPLKDFSATCDCSGSETIEAFAKCQSLVKLDFLPLGVVEGVQFVEFKWSNLVELRVYCSKSLPHILRGCPVLKEVSLFTLFRDNVNDEELDLITTPAMLDIVKELAHIEVLDVANMFGDFTTMSLTSEVLLHCLKLKDLFCGASAEKDQLKRLVGERFNVWSWRVTDEFGHVKRVR